MRQPRSCSAVVEFNLVWSRRANGPNGTGTKRAIGADRAQNTSGVFSVLSVAPVYRLAQRLIGAEQFRRFLAEDVLVLDDHDRVLDIGCGTADILDHLPGVDYVGFDPSRRYIEAAAARFGSRGEFVTSADELDRALEARTVVMAIGVFHHMDDATVHGALELAVRTLRPGGRVVSVDPAFTDDQHPVSRFLISRDRGRHVRRPEEMVALVADHFPEVDVVVRHDLLRLPYTHMIVQATAP